jgi:branched-subunit amino acid ABC-type transport system permease component
MKLKSLVFIASGAVLLSGAYLLAFLVCLGGRHCDGVLPILKLPFLYLLPTLGSQVLGHDSLNVLVLANTAFWGVLGACIVLMMLRRRPSKRLRAD